MSKIEMLITCQNCRLPGMENIKLKKDINETCMNCGKKLFKGDEIAVLRRKIRNEGKRK